MGEAMQLRSVLDPLLGRWLIEFKDRGRLLDFRPMRLLVWTCRKDPFARFTRQHRLEHLMQSSLDLAEEMSGQMGLRYDAGHARHNPAAVNEECCRLGAE